MAALDTAYEPAWEENHKEDDFLREQDERLGTEGTLVQESTCQCS